MRDPSKLDKIVIATLSFFAALLPRAVSLGTFLTADEALWLQRSRSFVEAVWRHDWAGTYVTAHPGVTTAWLSGLSLLVLRPQGVSGNLLAAAFPIALTSSVGVLLIYWLSSEIFDRRIALAAALLVAFDPFYIAHSRVV
jgi:4-amino-4-deoxy-L-arabinose transferase-like glycosyltransferase